MLRLQSSLTGKALALVKDLGYSVNAYERAKEKLEKKYGGERRLQIKHLTALRGWRKVRLRNLEDMEDFQGILERVSIALKDCGPRQELQGHNLSLTAKEKLSEDDVQAYKQWLIDHSLEDSFESLIDWERSGFKSWKRQGKRRMFLEKENLMGHCQKEVEMAFEFVAEPLPPNQSQEVVWLTHLSRTITMGMQSL